MTTTEQKQARFNAAIKATPTSTLLETIKRLQHSTDEAEGDVFEAALTELGRRMPEPEYLALIAKIEEGMDSMPEPPKLSTTLPVNSPVTITEPAEFYAQRLDKPDAWNVRVRGGRGKVCFEVERPDRRSMLSAVLDETATDDELIDAYLEAFNECVELTFVEINVQERIRRQSEDKKARRAAQPKPVDTATALYKKYLAVA